MRRPLMVLTLLVASAGSSTLFDPGVVRAVDTPISINATNLDFEEVAVATTKTISVFLVNTGGSPFGPITMFGGAPPSAHFRASQNCNGATLPAGGVCMVDYMFEPTAEGVFQDFSNFTISPTTNQSDGEHFSVTMFGRTSNPPPLPPVALPPARLLDSRPGNETTDGISAGIGQRAAGSITEVLVVGRGNVTLDADAVFLNVTAVTPTGAGHLTVFPCGAQPPGTSNVNYEAGDVVPNAVFAKVGTGGLVCIYTHSATHLVVDVNGYVPDSGSPTPVDPARLLDSRPGRTTYDGISAGIGQRVAGSITEVLVAGRGNVAPNATAAFLNVTAVTPTGAGHLTVFPCGTEPPTASNVNYQPGDVVPNAVLAKIGTGGLVCIYSHAATHLIVDVNGYVASNGSPAPLEPARSLDSRPGRTTADGISAGIGQRAAGSITEVLVAGRGNVTLDADAVFLNVTAVTPTGAGHLTVFPCGTEPPGTSNVNYQAGDVVPNAVFAKIGTGGLVCIYTHSATHLVVDVNGYVS